MLLTVTGVWWLRAVELPVSLSIRQRERCGQMIEKVSPVDFFGAEGFPALGGSGVALDDWEGCLRVYCEYSVSVGVKRERYIRLSTL